MKSIYPNLDSLMEERGIDYRDLARETAIDDITLYRRLKGTSDLKLTEVLEICEYFGDFDVKRMFTRELL